MNWPRTLFLILTLTWALDFAVAESPYLIVLGIAQDGGVPQAGTKPVSAQKVQRRFATSLALVDPDTSQRWLFEATPDFREQLYRLDQSVPVSTVPGLDGVFLTHAHIGHYTGLMHLGHEALGAQGVPVYVMPRMARFLAENGPWSQLVKYRNIRLVELAADRPVRLNERLRVTAFKVPHREEFSEVVGFRIEGPDRSVLFIPDIDSWADWAEQGSDLTQELAAVDLAYIDGTFFSDGEIPGRDMSGFPHPRIEESMQLLGALPESERRKVRFIHLNHTNPALDPGSAAYSRVEAAGFAIASEGDREGL